MSIFVCFKPKLNLVDQFQCEILLQNLAKISTLGVGLFDAELRKDLRDETIFRFSRFFRNVPKNS